MSFQSQYGSMQESLQEAKDIINELFTSMKAPSDWQINHMTFDELIGSLYKVLAVWNGEHRAEVTVTPDTLLKDITAYDTSINVVKGNIPLLESKSYTPGTERIVIESKQYLSGQQVIEGSANLKPENIRKDVNIFGITGTMEEGTGDPSELPSRDPITATSDDIVKPLFAYDNQLEKVSGNLNDKRDSVSNGKAKRVSGKSLYISPDNKAVYNNNSELTVPLKDIGHLLDIDPSKIESGYEILGIIGTKPIPNEDTNGDGEPDINIPVCEDDAEWINDDTVRPEDKNNPIYLNEDTDNDKEPEINIDTNDDGKPDLNIDTDKDGEPDVNIDTNNDGQPDLNIDTDGDYKPDLDIDTDGDGQPDVNVDIDGDGIPDINIDTNGDMIPDINIDTDGDKEPDINIDTDGDGKPDINIDTNGDGKPDVNIDTDGNGLPDINIDTNGDLIPDINIDTNNDGLPDINIDTNNDGIPDLNIDTDGDGKPDVNIDTNEDNEPDLNVDTNGDGIPDINIDTDGDMQPDLNVDTNDDGIPDLNVDTDGDGEPDVNIDTDGDMQPDINIDTDGDLIPDINIDTNNDGEPDINIDTNNDNEPDINIDTDRDGKPDVNIDTDGDGVPDTNLDTDGDGLPDMNIDTDGDGEADTNLDTDGDGIPDTNINDHLYDLNQDTNGDGEPDLNIDTNNDGLPDVNIDNDGDGLPDVNIDNDRDGVPDTNIDTDNDGLPDINIDTDHDGEPDINIDNNNDNLPDVNIDNDRDGKPDLNIDTNDDGEPDVNIDTNDDGRPDVNIDTNHDGDPDVNIDTDNDGIPDINIDNNRDGIPDLNVDTNDDGQPDLNIDTNNDGKPDINIDTNHDGNADTNIDTDGDNQPDLNIDNNRDGEPDVNIDTNNDGQPDTNIDTNNDGLPDVNIDTDEDGEPDLNICDDGSYEPFLNIDNDGDGLPDLNIDTDNDGSPDVNIDDNHDGKPDINIDSDHDGYADTNIDSNHDGKPDVNIDTNHDGQPDVNIDDDGDGIPDRNVDNNHDGIPDTNIDTDNDGEPDKNRDRDHDGIPDKDQKGTPHDPDDDSNSDYDSGSKDDRMSFNENDINDSKIDRDEVSEDDYDEDNHNEEDNPNFDENHHGDDGKDDDHNDLIEVEDEDGNKAYVPNPALQWAYSDYYLPMIYPTTQVKRPEKYAKPIKLTKEVKKTYSVIDNFFVLAGSFDYQHAKEFPRKYANGTGECLMDDNGEKTYEETVEYMKDYSITVIKNKFDVERIRTYTQDATWVNGASGSDLPWADDDNPSSGSHIYLDSNGKLRHSDGSFECNVIFEKKNTRESIVVQETQVVGEKTSVQAEEVTAVMIPLVRYAITQESRAKMYHYGNDTYLDNDKLCECIKQELPKLKTQMMAAGANILPPNGVYYNYMMQWRNPQGMPETGMYYASDAYVGGGSVGIERADYDYFQHNNYIEDAMKLYKRLGKIFEKNGQVNSYTYTKLGGGTLREAPTVNIEGESMLQVYVADLKLSCNDCYYIWRAAFNDYADYLPVFCGPIYDVIQINDTINETRIDIKEEAKVGDINDIEIVNSAYQITKDIITFVPGTTQTNVNLTVTMNTRHWNGFTLYEYRNNAKNRMGFVEDSHDHYGDNEFEPYSMTLKNVTLEAGKTYVITTRECDMGGTEQGKFVYNFGLTDASGHPINLQIQYSQKVYERTSTPKNIQREIVEHMYLPYYPEDFRQECFQDIEDTFQDLTQYVEQYVGVKYKEHHVGNIFQRGSTYTSEEKKKIAKCIHDYLIVNNAYAYGDDMNQTLYPAMSRGKRSPVCASYSLAFKYCCVRYGIVCHIVTGICNPGGEHTDSFGGCHQWNRINYEPYSFTERQYLHNNGLIGNDGKSPLSTIDSIIKEYDADNLNHYYSNGNTYFFTDPSYEGNDKTVTFIQSHRQYDKAYWSDVDVTWDDPSEPGTDTIGNTSNICWDYFNVNSEFIKASFSGSRLYAKAYMTDTGIQCYANLVGQDSHQDQYPSGRMDLYTGSTLYGW